MKCYNKISSLISRAICQYFPATKLFFDQNVGTNGFVGAILDDGTLVALCSKEKWDLGPNDSLRKGWKENYKIFKRIKVFNYSYSVEELKQPSIYTEKLTVPESLKQAI